MATRKARGADGGGGKFAMRKKAVRAAVEFSVMVIGQAGLGKSTFVNTLFEDELLPPRDKKDFSTPLDAVQIETVSEEVEVMGQKLAVTVVEAPGFGDLVDNSQAFEPIKKHIEDQFWAYLTEEKKVVRRKIKDTRIHVCLYFLPPTGHGLREIDLEFMKRMHGRVNLVPILAKADTFTPDELKDYKQRIKDDLVYNKIQYYAFADDEGNPTSEGGYPPFSTVGAADFDKDGIGFREYPWGKMTVDSTAYSDFGLLAQLLLVSHLEDLRELTDSVLYEAFRSEKLKKEAEGDDEESTSWQLRAQEQEFEQQRLAQERKFKEMEDALKAKERELKRLMEEQEKKLKMAELSKQADSISDSFGIANFAITGNANPGARLTAMGALKRCTGEYQWYADDKAITRATDKEYLVPKTDLGKSLTCRCIPVEEGTRKRGDPVISDAVVIRDSNAAFVSDLKVVGNLVQFSKLRATGDFTNCDKRKCKWVWLRRGHGDSAFSPIVGSNDPSYTLEAVDVGALIEVRCTPPNGQMVSFRTSEVQEAVPTVEKFSVSGMALEGQVLRASGTFEGCSQSDCVFVWSRSDRTGKTFEVIAGARATTYVPTGEDIGRSIQCSCTPVGEGKKEGKTVSARVDNIKAGKPMIQALKITGTHYNNAFAVEGRYTGGKEGKSKIVWSIQLRDGDRKVLDKVKGRKFSPTIEDVGGILRVEYTPIREDGVSGETQTAETKPIEVDPVVNAELQQMLILPETTFQVSATPSMEVRSLVISKDRIKVRQKQKTKNRVDITPSTGVLLDAEHNAGLIIDCKDGNLSFAAESVMWRDTIFLVLKIFVDLKQPGTTRETVMRGWTKVFPS